MLLDSFAFQINEFCEQTNVDVDLASKYFLDVLFERRNHLVNTWINRKSSSIFIPYLLNVADLASSSLGKFVDDKSYLSSQRQQSNDLYALFNARKNRN
ncbi:hypothetical protein JXA48_04255 [Candidatus Woesearchaeota archaeon]|nr:hypothetical protein [Candidatus Woesearchaeota archaeon]